MGPGCPGCVCLHVYCLFTQSARTATRSYLHSGDSCAAREAVIDTRVPKEPVCCHDASKTQVFDKLVLRQGVSQASAALPNRPGQPSSRRHANPAKQGSVSENALSAAPAGLERAEQNRSMPESGGILSQRDEQTLLQHQCRLVGTCYGGRSLVPALLRWGQLALRIRAPQTVLFQDEHGRSSSKPALTRSS
jgi:hypothetical protein